VAANAIAKAREAFERKTATVCGGRDRTCNADSIDEALPVSLGWPEMCPGSLQIESPSCSMAVNDCGDVVSCLECVDASAYQGAVSFVFKSMIPVDAKASPHIGKCQRAVGKATRAYVVKRSQTLAKCWTEQIGGIRGGLCPDPGAPEGSDPRKAADAIAKIEAKLRSVICAACADPMQRCDDVDPGLIGFPSLCPDVTSSGGSSCSHSISTLRDAIDCIRCIGDFTVNCTDAAQVPQLKAYPKNCSAQLP
jgi:hypothetical protein